MCLHGGLVVDPAAGVQAVADVWVERGRVVALGPCPHSAPWEVVDVSGLVVCPGLIDVHVHLRVPGQEHKETLASGTAAAVAGGFTTVCCMPNTSPPLDRPRIVAQLQERLRCEALCRVAILGAATVDNCGETLTDFADLAAAGCVAVTDDAFPLADQRLMAQALQRAARAGVPFIAHCEDKSLSREGVVNEGSVSQALGVPGQSPEAESRALAAWLAAAADAQPGPAPRLHVAHVSAAATLQVAARAAGGGGLRVNLSLETAPHYFALTEQAVVRYGADAKMNPPLRSAADRMAVRAALREGRIRVIATDHAPHSPQEKAAGLLGAPFGVVGLETALGVALTELVHSGEMPLSAVLATMTCHPARALGLTDETGVPLGTLAPGATADLTVLDVHRRWTVDPARFRSKGRNTPFAGCTLQGQVWGTLVAGRWVMREGQLLPDS